MLRESKLVTSQHVMSERMLEVMRTKMLAMLLTTPSGLLLLEELRRLDREEERLS